MITGILNSVVQLDLSQKDLGKFKVLKINYQKHQLMSPVMDLIFMKKTKLINLTTNPKMNFIFIQIN